MLGIVDLICSNEPGRLGLMCGRFVIQKHHLVSSTYGFPIQTENKKIDKQMSDGN